MKIKIGKTLVSNKSKCFIIAEMSGNHNKSLNDAIKIIYKAKKCGANAIKLQTYTADTITMHSNKKDFKISRNSPWYRKKTLWNLYNYASTPWSWHKKLFKIAKKAGIEIFASPFDESAVDLLEKLNCPAYKIASSEINHIQLLKRVAKTKKPVILSDGLADLKDVDLAIKTLRKNNSNKIILLICKSLYPANIEDYNINLINYYKKKYNIIIGLSDHSTGNSLAISALTIGAKVFEKHFKLNSKKKSVDSFFSQNENEFTNYIQDIRRTEKALKNKIINKRSEYKKMRSIYINKSIKKNTKLEADDVKICRPGYSLHPKFYEKILGKKVKKNFYKGDRIKLTDFK